MNAIRLLEVAGNRGQNQEAGPKRQCDPSTVGYYVKLDLYSFSCSPTRILEWTRSIHNVAV